ncbi:MAG: LysR family transcriptional regulator [Pseudomonadota bacterium]
MIDIAEFKMVETICTTGSLTKAADALFVSQPTLSKRLARLEEQLGAKLFHRASNGLQPTPIATYLVDSSTSIKASISGIERQVERILAHDQGEVRIGVGPIIEQVLLPSVLVKLSNKSGNVRFSVLTERANVLVQQLKSGELDVIAGPFGTIDQEFEEAGITAIELISERTINVARADHPIFTAKGASFFDYAYAAPPLQGTMQSSVPRGLERRRLSSDNYTLLKKVALETDYICGGPKEIFRAEFEAGTMREVPDTPYLDWRSACLFKTEALETPLVRLFVETLVNCRDEYLKLH